MSENPTSNSLSTGLPPLLTTVELIWFAHRVERWIRFGDIARNEFINANTRKVSFAPGSIFAFVRWASNGYGTIFSRIDILRAVGPGETYSTVPEVSPGAEILLRMSGWPKVQRVLAIIDLIEKWNIKGETVCPDYWRHVMNRLSANEEPRLYTPARHAVWLKRREFTL